MNKAVLELSIQSIFKDFEDVAQHCSGNIQMWIASSHVNPRNKKTERLVYTPMELWNILSLKDKK